MLYFWSTKNDDAITRAGGRQRSAKSLLPRPRGHPPECAAGGRTRTVKQGGVCTLCIGQGSMRRRGGGYCNQGAHPFHPQRRMGAIMCIFTVNSICCVVSSFLVDHLGWGRLKNAGCARSSAGGGDRGGCDSIPIANTNGSHPPIGCWMPKSGGGLPWGCG